jgi:predicted RNase H-like HicB family nuclease
LVHPEQTLYNAGSKRGFDSLYRNGGDGMKQKRNLTAIIEREGNGYVALCPELDIASQGGSIEEARRNLLEALELFFEAADPNEVASRMHDEIFVTRLEVAVG